MKSNQKKDNLKNNSCVNRISKKRKCDEWKKNLNKICKCSICMQSLKNPVRIKECNHIFCKQCIFSYILHEKTENKCPLCRQYFHTSRIFKDRDLNDILDQFKNIPEDHKSIDSDSEMIDAEDKSESVCETNKKESDLSDFLNLNEQVEKYEMFVKYYNVWDERWTPDHLKQMEKVLFSYNSIQRKWLLEKMGLTFENIEKSSVKRLLNAYYNLNIPIEIHTLHHNLNNQTSTMSDTILFSIKKSQSKLMEGLKVFINQM